MDLGGFECFLQSERREDGGHALGEHRFAGAGRTDKQNVVTAGGGDFEGAFDGFLAFDVGEIKFVIGRLIENVRKIDAGGCDFQFAFEE